MENSLKGYLWYEWTHSTLPKYYQYFDEWYNALTDNQILYYTAYANGYKTPYEVHE